MCTMTRLRRDNRFAQRKRRAEAEGESQIQLAVKFIAAVLCVYVCEGVFFFVSRGRGQLYDEYDELNRYYDARYVHPQKNTA